MYCLSNRAKTKRKSDMLEVAEELHWYNFLHICLIGGLLLIWQMADKLTPQQRNILIWMAILVGGTLVTTLIYFNFVWLALVIVFVLGIAISEIRHM